MVDNESLETSASKGLGKKNMSYYNSNAFSGSLAERVSLPVVMQRVYLWMFIGLLVTAGVAGFVGSSIQLVRLFINLPSIIILGIVQFGLVWYIMSQINNLSPRMATGLFLLYSVLTGLTLSAIFVYFTIGSIAFAFVTTAATFGVVSLFAYTTKMDLSKLGNILFVALIGLIIATVVNIFLASSALYWIINYAGVLIFVGLTAYDTQKIKNFVTTGEFALEPSGVGGYNMQGDGTMGMEAAESATHRVAILGALILYLDFVNLFMFILRIVGVRRD
jgi:hypothetical protein